MIQDIKLKEEISLVRIVYMEYLVMKSIQEYVFNKTQRKGINRKRNGHKQKNEDEIIKIDGGMYK